MGLKSFIKSRLFRIILVIMSMTTKINPKKVIVDNFFGRGYGDNPKYIVSQLLKLDDSLDITWLVNKNSDLLSFPSGVRTVKYHSIKSAYELATAHIWIDNIKNNYKGKKKKGQFYLQTWHGGIGFKKVEKAAMNTLNDKYIRESKADSKQIDLMISNSDWLTRNYRENFWYTGRIAKTGLPRNDIFFSKAGNINEKVKNFYGIDSDTEIILYAPTFRNYISINEQKQVCSFDVLKVINAFQRKFNKKFILVKRMHPNVADEIYIDENNYLRDGSKYPDMQELLVAADVLITDFSSSAFDFMLKSDKIFLFASDYENYILNERRMEFDLKKDLPFLFANDENELVNNISSFNEKKMYYDVQQFKNRLGLMDDGKASERVANLLINEIYN